MPQKDDERLHHAVGGAPSEPASNESDVDLYGNPHPTSFPGSQSSVRIAASKFLEFGVVDWWSQTKPERPDGEQLISQFGCIFSVCIWILFVFVSFAALTLFHRLCLTA